MAQSEAQIQGIVQAAKTMLEQLGISGDVNWRSGDIAINVKNASAKQKAQLTARSYVFVMTHGVVVVIVNYL